MLNRPRCRDWSPLATQQLRLRNLIQITGHNIEAAPDSVIYFTLHQTSMSAPFFTSDKVDSMKNAIWSEINCQTIHKSTSQFVCVRVWQSLKHHNNRTDVAAEPHHNTSIVSTKSSDLSTASLSPRSSSPPSSSSLLQHCDAKPPNNADKILFMWGVYLSGLIPISKRSDVKLKDNALVFYMHGGFFTSNEHLQTECIPKQYFYFHNLQPPHNQHHHHPHEHPIENTTATTNDKRIQANQNCDSSIASSFNNVNPIEMRTPPWQQTLLDSSMIHRCNEANESGEAVNCTGDQCCCNQWDANALKIRYIDREFYKMEIRNSYHVQKLLLLQEKQRICRNKTISSNELIDKICMRSAFCLNLKLIANKGMLYRPRGNPSIGRTLNRLLTTQPEQPKPEDLLKAQELRRRIETAKFRCRFLTMERDRHKVNLRKLQTVCGKLSDENIDKESTLMANYRELSRNRELAGEKRSMHAEQCKLYARVCECIDYRRKELLVQLRNIYTIDVDAELHRFFKINGIYLPNADEYMDGSLSSVSTARSICVALGYVAHILLLCSTILNIPLRNRIIYYGSESRIRDDIKVLSEHDREFPLFCRSIPPTDSLLYAVFLLNQNISQIKYQLNVRSHREDIRATLPNLFAILSAAEASTHNLIKQSAIKTQSLCVSNEHDAPASSVSNSSIDFAVPVPVNKTYSVSDNNLNGTETIISNRKLGRTTGSCSDEQLIRRRERTNREQTILESRFHSEPILKADATTLLQFNHKHETNNETSNLINSTL